MNIICDESRRRICYRVTHEHYERVYGEADAVRAGEHANQGVAPDLIERQEGRKAGEE